MATSVTCPSCHELVSEIDRAEAIASMNGGRLDADHEAMLDQCRAALRDHDCGGR